MAAPQTPHLEGITWLDRSRQLFTETVQSTRLLFLTTVRGGGGSQDYAFKTSDSKSVYLCVYPVKRFVCIGVLVCQTHSLSMHGLLANR